MTFKRFAAAVVAAALVGCGGSQSSSGAPPLPNAVAPFAGTGQAAATERVLYSFTGGNDGGNAATALVLDAQGNLYGTTVVGGTSQCGTVFQLRPNLSVPWYERVLFSFDCFATGKNPHGGVTFAPDGALVGTTVAGGSGGSCVGDGCGTVFRLRRMHETVLHSFTGGADGFGAGSAVVFDRAGHAFGTTPDGGNGSEGTVYEVSSDRAGAQERVIHAFTGGNDGGVGSLGALLVDASGDLFGVTEIGGAHGAGTVYRLTHGQGRRWRLQTLYAFKGTPDAASPYGGLIRDSSGNFYGTTYYGGTNGLGAVYELAPRGRRYRERVLYSFTGGNDGTSPTATLVADSAGVLYGTTSMGGGTCDCGTVFSVDPSSGKERVLHRFGTGSDGANPYYGMTLAENGNLFGTTVAGGKFGQGTVFELTP